MARKPRVHFSGAIYHVIARGNNKETIFKNDSDKHAYLNLIRKYKIKFGFRLFAYVLMDNHVHLLTEVREHSLAKIMQCLQLCYTQYFNIKYCRSGHVFQQRYKALLCSDDSHLLTLVKYIHANPIRAQITSEFSYPWSSHNAYVQKYNSLVDTDFLLSMMDKNQEEAITKYLKFIGSQEDAIVGNLSSAGDEQMRTVNFKSNNLTIEEISDWVGGVLRISPESISEQSKKRCIVNARSLTIFLAINSGVFSGTQAAKYFNVSESAVSRACSGLLRNMGLINLAHEFENIFGQNKAKQA